MSEGVAMQRWKPGEACVLRGIFAQRVWLAQSVIVVQDNPDETILLLLPGAQCAFPEGYWRWKHGDYSQGDRWEEGRRGDWTLREFAWQTNRLLMFLEPEKYYSCWLFWDHALDQFTGYYINFQLPYQRSHCGFDTFDLDLDLVVAPDFTWVWKDRQEYQEGIRAGAISAQWAEAVAQAESEVFARLAARAAPLDTSWLGWHPDPAWDPPGLPEGWQEL